MAQVFLSYATEDWERVKTLADALGKAGFSVFWDRTILPGDMWRQVLKRELEGAGCVVVAWSQKSIASPWVLEEAEIAKDRLVPVRLDPVALPFGFGQRQAADLVHWKGDTGHPTFEAVCRSITTRLGTPLRATPPPQTSSRVRLAWWGGALVAAVAAGAAGWVTIPRDEASGDTTLKPTAAALTPVPTLGDVPTKHPLSTPPEPRMRRVYWETFSDAAAVSAELWARGKVGDWFGKVEQGTYQLCNATKSEQSSYTATFSYLEDGNALQQVGASIKLTVWLGEGLGNHSMAGILFRASPDKKTYYALARSAGHSLTLLQKRGNQVKLLSTWDLSQTSDVEPVRLRVDTGADECQLFVNDKRIDSVVEPAQGDERNGAFAMGKGCFYFDDASLYLPSE